MMEDYNSLQDDVFVNLSVLNYSDDYLQSGILCDYLFHSILVGLKASDIEQT